MQLPCLSLAHRSYIILLITDTTMLVFSHLYLTLWFLLVTLVSAGEVDVISQNISIQQTNETFFAYIPLSSDCLYPKDPNIQPYSIEYTLLDPPAIYSSIAQTGEISFWAVMPDGLRMLLNGDSLLLNGTYTQIVLYNSSLSSNFTQREVILTSFTLLGEIVFNFAEPVYNYSGNTLTPRVVSQRVFALGPQVQFLIRECNKDGRWVWITYAGGGNFMGLCPNTTNIFIWSGENHTEVELYSDLSFLGGANVENMTINPILLFPEVGNVTLPPFSNKSATYAWNIILLIQGGGSCFFCKASLSSLSCQSFLNSQNWLQIVIQRGWGMQSLLQFSQIQLILTQYPQLLNLSFPGTIISIFSYSNTLFIQSQDNTTGTVYLGIFLNGRILANTSLLGEIIYYGEENLVVQAPNGTFYIVDFLLPIFEITPNGTQPQNYSLDLVCSYSEYHLQYSVFWSNIQFPSYIIQQVGTPQVSQQSVMVDNLDEFFLIMGPAFEVFIGLEESGVQINLLDVEDVLGASQMLQVVSILFSQGGVGLQGSVPYYIIFLDSKGILRQYKLGSREQAIPLGQPCGITEISNSYTLQGGYIFTNGETLCYCQGGVVDSCSVISPQQLPGIISGGTNSLGEYTITLSQIMQDTSPQYGPTSPLQAPTNAIKKQLLAVVNQDLIVNIYQNNSVTLTNFQGEVIAYILSVCQEYNSTDGTIFTRNFYDDYLIIYCYESPTITQYLIRNQTFIFNRVVPIYGFLTNNSEIGILSGQNYVFLSVKINPLYFGTVKSINSTSCCILRLDPTQYTVSVIAEIILADQLLTIYSMYGVDIVLYNSTEVSGEMASNPSIKVYFDSSWMAFTQSIQCTPQTPACTPTTYTYSVALISDFYNFAGCFIQNVTFDISASIISFSSPDIYDVELSEYTGNYVFFNSSVNYSFNTFCGPISSFHQRSLMPQGGGIFLITEEDIITKSKELTNNYEPIIQIIDIADYAPQGSSLAGCLMVVSLQNISFYLKYNGTWMTTLGLVTPPQPNCLYFVSQIVNQSTIEFGSDCYNVDISTPTITVTYLPADNSTGGNYTFIVTFGQMQLPIQLRSVTSIILNTNQTVILGIQQGPSKSISGVLYICNISFCNSLTIRSKIVFFIDFDQQLTPQGLLVVGLDVYKLSVWIDPNVQPANASAIPADFIVNYQEQLGYSCSKVKIVAASFSKVNLVLSCTEGYQQIEITLANPTDSIASQVKTFTKFANCQSIDRFKPEFIVQPNSTTTISFLATECQQSVDVVRLQQIYSLNSNATINIVTAYLLIYAYNGPMCSASVWSPIRMIDIGTNQQYSSFLIYSANGEWKLLYQQIDGILIDNFVSLQPNTYYELIELTKDVIYPQVLMTIKNPYYVVGMTIETAPVELGLSTTLFYTVLGIFVCFNAITVLFFVCWCCFRRNVRRNNLRFRAYSNSFNNNQISVVPSRINPSKYMSDKESRPSSGYEVQREQQGSNIYTVRVNGARPQERRRKGTEIELFQPR